MANPTDISTAAWGGRCAAGVANQTLAVDPQQSYTVYHTGKAAAGSADTNDIFFSDGATATASFAVGSNRLVVPASNYRVFRFPSGQCNYISASGAPVFEIVPQVDASLKNS